MKTDLILEEVWRIKDKLSREMATDPLAYSAKLNDIIKKEEQAGRKIIRSAQELNQFAVDSRRPHSGESVLVLKENPPKKN